MNGLSPLPIQSRKQVFNKLFHRAPVPGKPPHSLPKKSEASPTVGGRVSSMLRGEKVTGEEEGKEEDALGPGGREHPQANTRLTPSATRRGRERVWGWIYFIVFYLQGWARRPFPGVLGGALEGDTKGL